MFIHRLLLFFVIISFFSTANAANAGGNTYWATPGFTNCNQDLSSLCASVYGGTTPDDTSCTTTSVECSEALNGALRLRTSCPELSYGQPTGKMVPSGEFRTNITYYSKYTVNCGPGTHLKLTGCQTECLPDTANKCADKAGQEEHRKQQCGVAHGTGCHWQDSTNKLIVCDHHETVYAPLIGTKTSIDGCEVLIGEANPSVSGGNQDLGENPDPAGAMNVICDLTLQYTGEETPADATSGLGSPAPAPTKSLTSPESTETKPKADGSSEKTTKSTKTNADGSKTTTTTKEITSPDGTKSTSTSSSTTPAGTTTGTGTSGSGNCATGTTSGTGCSSDPESFNANTPAAVHVPEGIKNTITKSFWQPVYTDGLGGVWSSHVNDLNNTPVYGALNQFKAGVPNSGSCPSFVIPLGEYTGSISPPCFIWPVLRAIFLFSTMMLCRRIVFGG